MDVLILKQKNERLLQAEDALTFAYPTPHFEATALRCSNDMIIARNRFGSSWEWSEMNWTPDSYQKNPFLDHSDLHVNGRVYSLPGTPREPMAASNSTAATFDGKNRITIYKLGIVPKLLYGVKVDCAPKSVDVNDDELLIFHSNATIVRYDLASGLFLSATNVENNGYGRDSVRAVCIEKKNSMLLALTTSIKRVTQINT